MTRKYTIEEKEEAYKNFRWFVGSSIMTTCLKGTVLNLRARDHENNKNQ